MTTTIRILILGASYGILPATKLSLAGHAVTLLGKAEEVAQLAQSGTELLIPAKEDGRQLSIKLSVHDQPSAGVLAVTTPEQVRPADYDLIVLAMQEPQYKAAEIRDLLARISEAHRPCLSIMNMPPLPFLSRILNSNADQVSYAYSSSASWQELDPALVTLASPDPQAVRTDPSNPGLLKVTLATNFKLAPFASHTHQELLQIISEDVDQVTFEQNGQTYHPRVRFVARTSLFTPLAKWPMLIAGNCRCIADPQPRSISNAVWDDVTETKDLYNWVYKLVSALGAAEADLVPFAKYAEAAKGLILPSSLARGLHNGATAVERIDRLVWSFAQNHHMQNPQLDQIVKTIDSKIQLNTPVSA